MKLIMSVMVSCRRVACDGSGARWPITVICMVTDDDDDDDDDDDWSHFLVFCCGG